MNGRVGGRRLMDGVWVRGQLNSNECVIERSQSDLCHLRA